MIKHVKYDYYNKNFLNTSHYVNDRKQILYYNYKINILILKISVELKNFVYILESDQWRNSELIIVCF